MKQACRLLVAAVLALVLGACASRPAQMGVELPPPDTTTSSGAYEGATDYRVGSQALLQISVFGVDDLTHQARVNSNGMINVPLIGGVMAGGKTIPELEKDLGPNMPKVICRTRRSRSSSPSTPASGSPWRAP